MRILDLIREKRPALIDQLMAGDADVQLYSPRNLLDQAEIVVLIYSPQDRGSGRRHAIDRIVLRVEAESMEVAHG